MRNQLKNKAIIGLCLLGLTTACGSPQSQSQSSADSQDGDGNQNFQVRVNQIGADINDPTAFIGETLPISVSLSAKDTIASFTYSFSKTNEGSDKLLVKESLAEGIVGTTKANFDFEIQLPDTLEMGDYLLEVEMADRQNSRGSAKYPVKLRVDVNRPIITDLEVGINDAGDDLHLAAEVMAPNKIAEIRAEIVGEQWSKEFSYKGDRIVDKLEAHFHEHAHLHDAPAGTYELTLIAIDKAGRQARSVASFTKK